MTKPPEFNTRDAAQSTFWDERFAAQFTPWDHGGVPEALKKFAENAAPASCLIPGSGNGYELAYLNSLGWDVTAIDFSPTAVANARKLFPTHADKFVLADFFKFEPTKPSQIIYERAFFCALPVANRENIVARWVDLLTANGLLIGYFHLAAPSGNSGPPFSIQREELDTLLSPHFVCIEDNPVSDSIAVFKNRERWMVWQKRV